MKKKENDLLKRFWKFYWKDDSLWSYLFFIIVTYLVLKFVLFPGFLFVFGLNDVVSVMTTSMVHGDMTDEYFYNHYTGLGFSREQINGFPMSGGLNVGDALLIRESDSFEVGDVIVFYSDSYDRKIIHRVVSTDPLTSKGDNNPLSYGFDQNITNPIGKPILKIPFLGLPRWLLYYLTGV